MDEVCDEKRFTKFVSGALAQIRNGVQDGLFTAHPGEHNWEIAHRVLMPGNLQGNSMRAPANMNSVWPDFNSSYVR
jgi:hypothetical protein